MNTINVVEIYSDGPVKSLRAFDTYSGIGKAEKLFCQCIKENDDTVTHKELQDSIDDGCWEDTNGYTIQLVHSSL